MARDTMYRRYENDKIQMLYVTLDLQLLDVMDTVITDRALIGEIVCALKDYERSAGETIPTLEDVTAQKFLNMLIEKHEMVRDAFQRRSDSRKPGADAAAEKRKHRPARDLD